jgi:hypothetical protein
MVALKYLDFKKDVDLDVHVKKFDFIVKVKITSEKFTINAFSYMLRDITSDWCIITCQNSMFLFSRNLHKHFANVIARLRMTNKYTCS